VRALQALPTAVQAYHEAVLERRRRPSLSSPVRGIVGASTDESTSDTGGRRDAPLTPPLSPTRPGRHRLATDHGVATAMLRRSSSLVRRLSSTASATAAGAHMDEPVPHALWALPAPRPAPTLSTAAAVAAPATTEDDEGDVSEVDDPLDSAAIAARVRALSTEMPTTADAPPAPVPADARSPLLAGAQVPRRRAALPVLIVEDNAVNLMLMRHLVTRRLGLRAATAADGQAALAAWSDSEYGLIFMDLQMPIMDGLTATREIRRLEAAEGRPRAVIVATTGLALAEDEAAARAAGCDAFVTKPIDMDWLAHRIPQWLAEPY
jgi:CheY-like chemotaxis protein